MRITRKDREEYARLRKSGRSKLTRLQNKYAVDLTGEITLPDLESFTSRKEYNEWKSQIKSFTNRHNTNYQFRMNAAGLVATVKELNTIKKNNRLAKQNTDKLIKEVESTPFIAASKVGTHRNTFIELPKHDKAKDIPIVRPFRFDAFTNQSRMNTYAKNMARKADKDYHKDRMAIMRDNYIDRLRATYGDSASSLLEKLEGMSGRDFYLLYHVSPHFNFEDLYGSDEQEEAINGQIDGSVQLLETLTDKFKSGELSDLVEYEEAKALQKKADERRARQLEAIKQANIEKRRKQNAKKK